MSGLISQHFIDQLLARIDIVDVVEQRITLKKAGANYKACCPFHGEKTPSFTVSQTKQFYHCFGCGAHGTAISFIMEHDRVGFVDAVEMLAEQTGLEIVRDGGDVTTSTRDNHSQLYKLMDAAQHYYGQQLRQDNHAIQYLKQRGLSGEIAAEFGIGYAPPGWDNLLKHLHTFAESDIKRAGMLSGNEQRVYDRFRERIMFPIKDRRGRVIGFGGRVLGDGEPKYLNSPETPLFHKGTELYGLYEARQRNRQLDHLIVVEGYMDVVALFQHGITHVVATLGTATTTEHLQQLFRLVSKVTFCFDGDRAGREAAWRALNNALPLLEDGRDLAFLFLPDGEDPDSLVQAQGQAAFESAIQAAQPLVDFLMAELTKNSGDGLGDKAAVAERAKPLLAKIPPGIYHDLLEKHISQHVGLNVEMPVGESQQKPVQRRRKSQQKLQMTPMRTAIAMLLQYPVVAQSIPVDDYLLPEQEAGADLLIQLLATVLTTPSITTAQLLEMHRETPAYPFLCRLAVWTPQDNEEVDETFANGEFKGAIEKLREKRARAERNDSIVNKRPSEMTDAEKERLRQLYLKHS